MIIHNTPIIPRNPGRLRVLTIGRVSTLHQDPEMLKVQSEEVKKFLGSIYKGPLDLIELGEQVSGEEALRASYIAGCELIETETIDMVVLFDLSKAGRLPRFMHEFVDLCVDCGTRFISIGDNIDTTDENWEVAEGAATLQHGLSNRHTRHRIKAKGDYAFERGGMVTKIPFGFGKLSREEADSRNDGATGLRLAKNPECTPIIRAMKDRVMASGTYEQVAAWLNDERVPLGPYCQQTFWNGKLVNEFLRRPLLHGERQRSRVQVIRQRRTGQRIRKLNPNPMTKTWPQLAHLTPEEHGELIAEMDRRIAEHPRKRKAKVGPKGRARSRTFFPGQAMTCSVCGSLFYIVGSGGLKCCRSGDPAQGECWNHIQVNSDIVCREIMRIILHESDARPEFRKALILAALAECDRLRGREGRQGDQIDARIRSLRVEEMNLSKAIRKGGEMDVLVRDLREITEQLKVLVKERDQLAAASAQQGVPVSHEEIAAKLPEVLALLMHSSYEFADLLRRVIPVFVVMPMQAIDTGKPVARAHVTFSFGAVLHSGPSRDYQPLPDDFSVTLDLFDPPGHIRRLAAAVKVRAEHPEYSCEQIGNVVGANRWDVQEAMKLRSLMKEKGVAEPYVPVVDPNTVSRWRLTNSHKTRWDQAAKQSA